MPRSDDLPVLFLPRHLSAAAAAQFLEALHQLIAAMERHYGARLQRYYHRNHMAQRELDIKPAPTDPPF